MQVGEFYRIILFYLYLFLFIFILLFSSLFPCFVFFSIIFFLLFLLNSNKYSI